MTPEHLKELLEDVADHAASDISIQRNAVVFESYLPRRWPQVNWDRLLALYGDHPGDWPTIIAEYLEMAANDTPEQESTEDRPQKPALPLQVIGHAPDLFSGEMRPVYNREPAPGETLPKAEAIEQTPIKEPHPASTPPQLEPKSRAEAYEQEARIALDRYLKESQTWELLTEESLYPNIRRHIIGSREAAVSANESLNKAIHADTTAKEQAWTDANVLLGDAGVIIAQAMVSAHGAERAQTSTDNDNSPKMSDAAWRDLQQIEAVADTTRAALAYWQGREDAGRADTH